jgi:sterol desaturase/sphingolipid hydroxylase (fatty acid hydroxylase superfamily)
MQSPKIMNEVAAELEIPRQERPFGSRWLSGAVGLFAGIVGLLMVIVLRDPSITTAPQLVPIYESIQFRLVIYFVLIAGFGLAALSLVLEEDRRLGGAAMVVTLLASLIGSLPVQRPIGNGESVFSLDFFILNVLFGVLLFFPIERVFPHKKGQGLFRDEWREDLFYYAPSSLVATLFIQVVTYLTFAHRNPDLGVVRVWARELPWVVQIVVIMLLADITQYWLHRAFHRVPFLWRIHAVHHSLKSLDWVAGARMHFVEIMIVRGLTAIPMLVIGFEESAIQAYTLIVYAYSTFIHSNVSGSFGFLEKVLVAPRFHHWHHGLEEEAIDVNFSLYFPFIDRLFGTYHLPDGRWPQAYGIEGHPVPRGYWKQLLYFVRR